VDGFSVGLHVVVNNFTLYLNRMIQRTGEAWGVWKGWLRGWTLRSSYAERRNLSTNAELGVLGFGSQYRLQSRGPPAVPYNDDDGNPATQNPIREPQTADDDEFTWPTAERLQSANHVRYGVVFVEDETIAERTE